MIKNDNIINNNYRIKSYLKELTANVIISQIGKIRELFRDYGIYKGLKIWWYYKNVRLKKRGLNLKNKIVDVNDYSLELLPDDDGISTELALFKTHEPLNTKLLRDYLKEGMICLDVGANIGYYTLLESKIVGDQGRVIAIEPSPINFQVLEKNLKMANAKNVNSFCLAGGDKNGILKFLLERQSNLSRILREDEIVKPSDTIVDVPVKKLDLFVEELDLKKLDFLRMDVEGYEYQIYKGFRNSLKKFKPMIQMEFHCMLLGDKKTRKLLCMLKEDGYDIVYYIVREFDRPTVMNKKDVKKISLNQVIDLLDKGKIPPAFLTLLRPL